MISAIAWARSPARTSHEIRIARIDAWRVFQQVQAIGCESRRLINVADSLPATFDIAVSHIRSTGLFDEDLLICAPAVVPDNRARDVRCRIYDMDPDATIMCDRVVSDLSNRVVPAPDAVVIDTRTPAQYKPWHYPGATHRDFWDLLRDYASLDRNKTYVLYCDLGLKTAQLAEKMQKGGFEAYSFKGGVRALKEYADRSESNQ